MSVSQRLTGSVLLVLAVLSALGASPQSTPKSPVIIASKPFAESYILAEMFAQLLEARGVAVDRRTGFGATEIAFGALRRGAVDVYPEYTGTGLLVILGEPPRGDRASVYQRVSQEMRRRYAVRWLPPLGFENTYAIAVRPSTADSLHLRSLSDLARVSSLRAGLTPDFIGRADGLPGVQRAYGLHFRAVKPLNAALKYQALAAGDVDVIDGYSTDGLIARYGLTVLVDDRHFFPPYEAAALISERLARTNPAAVAALTELSGRLSVESMRQLNRRVEVEGVPVAAVAREALIDLALVEKAVDGGGRARSNRLGMLEYLRAQRSTLLSLTGRHLLLVGVSLGIAVLIAVPLGLVLERYSRRAELAIRTVGVLQTLPGIALLAFMIPLLGIGVVPALSALVLYSLYPIVRNTYTGVRDADRSAVDAATALGMTPAQVLRDVRLPLAAPVIMAGIRTAAVIDVGTATLAAFIGAGGLGEPIVSGLALADTRMILSGAIPAALLAIAVDGALALVERAVRPGG
jgi:osmoprotectant transport system permease protein